MTSPGGSGNNPYGPSPYGPPPSGEPSYGHPPYGAPGSPDPASGGAPGAPAGPGGWPWNDLSVPYFAPPPSWRPTRSALVAGLAGLILTVVLGAPLGLLWGHLSPRVNVVQVLVEGSFAATRPLFSADVHFLLLSLLAGVVAGTVTVLAFPRGRDWPMLVGLLIGGLVGGLIAIRVGQQVRAPGLNALIALLRRNGAPPGEVAQVRDLVGFGLRSHGVLVALPFAAVATAGLVSRLLVGRGSVAPVAPAAPTSGAAEASPWVAGGSVGAPPPDSARPVS